MPPFNRPTLKKRQKRRFVLAVEGVKTETGYFRFFDDSDKYACSIEFVARTGNEPHNLLNDVKKHIKNDFNTKNDGDYAFIVLDDDNRSPEKFEPLKKWATAKHGRFGFVISVLNFEYWLLLHCEDANRVGNRELLNKRCAKYGILNKRVPKDILNEECIKKAISRAKAQDNTKPPEWPKERYCSTVYRLVEKLMED